MRKVKNSRSIKNVWPRRISYLTLLSPLICGISLAQADPVCDFVVNIPVDGIIPSSSTVDINHANSCFSNPGTPINLYGMVHNNTAATLTHVGVLNIQSMGIANYGSFNNFTGAEVHVKAGVFQIMETGTLINNGLFDVERNGRLYNGGTIINKAGATLIDRGQWSENLIWSTIVNEGSYTTRALTNNGDLYNQAGAQWTNTEQLTLNVNSTFTNSGTLQNNGATTLSGLFMNGGGATINSAGDLNLDKPYASLINGGEVNLSGNAKLTVSSGATVSGTGTINHSGSEMRVDGVVSQSAITVSHALDPNNSLAKLNGSGKIIAPVSLLDGSQISAGTELTAGKLTIEGDLNFDGATLVTNIQGTTATKFDTLSVTGDVDWSDGTFIFDFGTFTPKLGDSWMFFVGDTSEFSLEEINFIFVNPKGFGFSVNVLGQGLQLATTTPPVPVPAAAWLLGSGLVGLIGVSRRKSKAV